MSTISFTTTAPLHLNGELVDVNIKRNALDQQNVTNWNTLQTKLNYNPAVAGTGLDSDNLSSGCILPRNLTKQTGSKDFYYYDSKQGTSYGSTSYPNWYVAGIAGGSVFVNFVSSTDKYISNTTPLSIVVNDNSSTIELDITLEAAFSNTSNSTRYIYDIQLSTSPTFATILQTNTITKHSITQSIGDPARKTSFTNLPAGTYYIRPAISVNTAVYGHALYLIRTIISYQVYNLQFA
jgi:hypothetical protein